MGIPLYVLQLLQMKRYGSLQEGGMDRFPATTKILAESLTGINTGIKQLKTITRQPARPYFIEIFENMVWKDVWSIYHYPLIYLETL